MQTGQCRRFGSEWRDGRWPVSLPRSPVLSGERPSQVAEYSRSDYLMRPNVFSFPVEEWGRRSAALLHQAVRSFLNTQGRCVVMLTGGRSAERLYAAWAQVPDFQRLSDVCFYFGDERCVPPEHPESNFGMVKRVLFKGGVPPGCKLLRMEGEDPDRDAAARRYGEALPVRVDVLLLGVGEDGHIASLFPGSPALCDVRRRVMAVTSPKPPGERLTVAPSVIAQATTIFVLAAGAAKAAVLRNAMKDPGDFVNFPARLVLNAVWLLDAPFPEQITQ